MVYSPNANWNAATASLAKAPVHIVRFDGYAAAQFSTGPVLSPSRTTKQYLSNISGLGQRVDPITGTFSIGAVSFVLADKNGEITDLLATKKGIPTLATLLNRSVSVLSGYAGLAESDYAPIAVSGVLVSVRQTPDLSAYEFGLGDPKHPTVTDIFTNADAGGDRVDTKDTLGVSAGAIAIGLDPAGISPDDKLMLGPNGSGDEERVEVMSVHSDSVVLKAPTQHAYSAGYQVRWGTTIVRGNPVNILYAILTDSFVTTGSFPLTHVQGLPTGLGLDPSAVDTVGLARERDDWLTNMVMSFEIPRRVRAQDFLAKEIFRLFGYPTVTGDGKIGFRAYRPRIPSDAALSLTEADIMGWAYERRLDVAYNRLVVKMNYDLSGDRFTSERVFEDTTDQATVGVNELVVELKGVPRTKVNDLYVGVFAKRFLRRYVGGCPQLRLGVHMTKRGAELGDHASITHSKLPNVRTGARGITAGAYLTTEPEWDVVRIDQDFDRDGKLFLTLQEGGFTRPMIIAPAGQANYGAASSGEKAYWYISPASGANFSDGSPPYKVP